MFNQTENMIARTEYQQIHGGSASFVEGVELPSEPGRVRRLFSALTSRKPGKTEKTPAQPTYERRALKTKHG